MQDMYVQQVMEIENDYEFNSELLVENNETSI